MIFINISTCFGHLYAHLQEYMLYVLHMVFSTRCCGCGPKEFVSGYTLTHRLLRTTATTPSAEHHMQ